MTVLIVLTEAPYGTDRPYNVLRLASALQAQGDQVRLFLMSDAVGCALENQSSPDSDLNLARRLEALIAGGCEVKLCGLCAETRGLGGSAIVSGVRMGSMPELAQWVSEADRTLTF